MRKILSTILLSMFLTVTVNAQESDRVVAYQSYEVSVNILTRTVKVDKKNNQIVRLWTESIFPDGERRNGRIESFQKYERISAEKDKWLTFRRTLELVQYDCGTDKYQKLETIHYSDDGRVIDSYTDEEPVWRYIVPETILESVYNKACHLK